MAKTKLHDIEVCIDGIQLKVIPYKLKIQYKDKTTPYFEADCSSDGQGPILEVSIKDKRNRDLVAHVLGMSNWDSIRTHWDGYSEWNTTESLNTEDAPSRVKTWLRKLPTYELKLASI
jgi:hypothetical protein